MSKKVLAISIAAFIIFITGINYYLEKSRELPDGLVQANGRIEGDSIIIASKQAGKVETIHGDEGDYVEAGQILIELDDQAIRARYAEAKASVEAAVARTEQSKAEYTILEQETGYRIAAAAAGVQAGKARLDQAIAEERQLRTEKNRYQTLAESDSVGRETAEQAELRWQQAHDQMQAAQAVHQQAIEALNDAQLGPDRIKVKSAEIAVLEASAKAAQARLEGVESTLSDMMISSPEAGAVTLKLVDVGEVINPGIPLLEIINLDRLYLKVFIPEAEIGKVRRGLPARVYIDAFPETPFAAEVRSIASRAEFTPKEIQTPDERVRLVYAVKLYLLENPDHLLTPGLPADAVIRWEEDAPWARPRW